MKWLNSFSNTSARHPQKYPFRPRPPDSLLLDGQNCLKLDCKHCRILATSQWSSRRHKPNSQTNSQLCWWRRFALVRRSRRGRDDHKQRTTTASSKDILELIKPRKNLKRKRFIPKNTTRPTTQPLFLRRRIKNFVWVCLPGSRKKKAYGGASKGIFFKRSSVSVLSLSFSNTGKFQC